MSKREDNRLPLKKIKTFKESVKNFKVPKNNSKTKLKKISKDINSECLSATPLTSTPKHRSVKILIIPLKKALESNSLLT